MKKRHFNLISYVVFLLIMYAVWHLSIYAKKLGGYDISEVDDLIQQFTISPKISIMIDISYDAETVAQINATIQKAFNKSQYFIIDSHIVNFNLNTDTHCGNAELQVKLQKSEEHEFIIESLQSIVIKGFSQDHIKNLRRYANKFMNFGEDDITYIDRLLIFDLFLEDISLVSHIETGLLQLFKVFNLDNKNLRINYQTYIDEVTAQTHDMNWQKFFPIQILQLNETSEENSVIYREPNQFLIYGFDQIWGKLYDIFIIVLQLEELSELTLDGRDYEPSLSLIVEAFNKREQLALFRNFVQELEFMKYIQQEGDYKISKESKQAYTDRLQYMKASRDKLIYSNTSDLIIYDKMSDLDTFSIEYTMGIYLPIILPFVYPIVMSLYDEYKLKLK